ncbi:hypothetical protein CP533_6044 [Ophiocordyceps camponoti-saundersi (nom. inval.)]|nr:hypothetical protein CP533_6044 [Ophiocordyceps camponoti-saundersi (nom. inval.)]
MASLPPPPPSYTEAVSRPDWLLLAMPYIRVEDFASLCRVDSRFWRVFAPAVWRDLLTFLHRTSPATRALARIIDARAFAKLVCDFSTERLLERSFATALSLLPNLDCLLLDGHEDLDPAVVLGGRLGLRLRVLSISSCSFPLPSRILDRPSFRTLVFLDASAVRGSIRPLLRPGLLPDLAVLKLRQREVNDAALSALAPCFPPRLWSLDLSDNQLTDAAVDTLLPLMSVSSSSSLRSVSRFQVEGEAVSLPDEPFAFIAESSWSDSFSHPERYFVDLPTYDEAGEEAGRLPRFNRHRAPLRLDSAEAVYRAGSEPEDGYRRPPGITHLHLSGNRLSSLGLQRLLRLSSGLLEDFDCCSVPLLPSGRIPGLGGLPRLYGLLGAAHLFRPVLSCNLRALRIHHSLVTHVPTIETSDDQQLSPLSRLYLAETSVLDRVHDLYPQPYEPDMNPRLVKLTLTGVPRRSSGPLTASLIRFLDLLASQERAIKDAPWSSATKLQGLRHLALEFEPDPMDDGCCQDVADGGECNGLEQGFSFFPVSSPPSPLPSCHSGNSNHKKDKSEMDRDKVDESIWLPSFSPESASASASSFPSGSPFRDYRRLVLEEGLCHGKAPVTPCQVRAGVAPGSYVYQTAYAAAVMPSELSPPPGPLLAGMRDVVAELRAFRRVRRGVEEEENRWGGRLECSYFFSGEGGV